MPTTESGPRDITLSGVPEIPDTTILTRLNYYDGKFLRADALRAEQEYLRRLAQLGAGAGGSGVVSGFDVTLAGDTLQLGAGLAFDGAGRALYLPGAVTSGLQKLIDATRDALAGSPRRLIQSGSFQRCEASDGGDGWTVLGPQYYLITIAHAEAACGEEDVFGTLCDDGCASATDRAYLVEGVVLRARPWAPSTPFATSKVVALSTLHTRSLLASAAFADEAKVIPSRISRAGLLSGVWCSGAAAQSGDEVALAVVGRLASGSFVDEWTVRRERIDVPPRRYWAWTMAMRPWEVFLAQVLQFQCQLPSALAGGTADGTDGEDPCAPQRVVLHESASFVQELAQALARPEPERSLVAELGGATRLADLQKKLAKVLTDERVPSQRILIDGGIVELPPGGYLPVSPGSTPSVQVQVRRLLGAGVDLRFCTVRPDYVPHALEQAQHMSGSRSLQGSTIPARAPRSTSMCPTASSSPRAPRSCCSSTRGSRSHRWCAGARPSPRSDRSRPRRRGPRRRA